MKGASVGETRYLCVFMKGRWKVQNGVLQIGMVNNIWGNEKKRDIGIMSRGYRHLNISFIFSKKETDWETY